MAKVKTSFFCQNCGYESAKWVGKCPSCNEWNTFVEETLVAKAEKATLWKEGKGYDSIPVAMADISAIERKRIVCPDHELNRVLGGGIVNGSLVLFGGEPGIGKSTLMLQVALDLPCKVLYVSGEESHQQIKMRADRFSDNLTENTLVLCEISIERIFSQIKFCNPDLLIIDSIQTLTSSNVAAIPGSISQIRQCAGELLRFAKESGTPVFLVGHITKDGSLAGPKVLEHMVDTVLQFEGDRNLMYRILRTSKNRFGSTDEIGIYEMESTGLRQVSNPSEILISQRDHPVSGVAIGATMEGSRPLLIEIQALVSTAAYGTPQRTATGFDGRRLNMLLAVLEKRTGLKLASSDVFINMAGGIRVDDPAVDLAVCVAILSAFHDVPIPEKSCFAAEVGLSGELRSVTKVENRIKEAVKLGFDKIYVSKYNKKKEIGIEACIQGTLRGVFGDLFG